MGKLSRAFKESFDALKRGKIGRAWQKGPNAFNPIEKLRRKFENKSKVGRAWRAMYRQWGLQNNTGLGSTSFTGGVNSARSTIGQTVFHRYT